MPSWVQQEAEKHRKNTLERRLNGEYDVHEYYFCCLSIRLLDVIAGRKNPVGLKQGHVLVDGKVVTPELRLSSGYVVQVRL